MQVFKETFNYYQENYRNIFSMFYPSLNSTGFQERNLTVNFSKAYETACKMDNVFSWFELQFGESNNEHFDCVIVNVTRKQVFIIEAKRFTSSSKKSSIESDIVRIKSFVANGLGERFEKFENYSVYGVILADVWQETNKKKDIRNSFEKGDYFKDESLKNAWHLYDVRDFKIKRCEAEYSLLSFIWKIK